MSNVLLLKFKSTKSGLVKPQGLGYHSISKQRRHAILASVDSLINYQDGQIILKMASIYVCLDGPLFFQTHQHSDSDHIV